MITLAQTVQRAKELAAKDWPAAFPYGRGKWIDENYPRYLEEAKWRLRSEQRAQTAGDGAGGKS